MGPFIFFTVLMLVPGLLASALTKSTFNRYRRVRSQRGLTGAQAAAEMLRQAGVHNCTIEPTRGMLTDHYDPRARALRLSEDVYYGTSLASVGVACHEAGHALQHAKSYAPLELRSALVVPMNLCSSFYVWPLMIGMMARIPGLALIGIAMLGVSVLFSLVTLPVEWDASRRAKNVMQDAGFLVGNENAGAAKVLNAAFLTYLASAVTAVAMLLWYLLPLLAGNRDD